VSERSERAIASGVPAAIVATLSGTGLDDDRVELKNGRRLLREHLPLVILAGDSGAGKSTAAAVLATEARSRGRRIVGMVTCYPDEEGAYKQCSDGTWMGSYVRDIPVEVGSRLLTGKWIHAPSAFDNLFLPSFWKALGQAELLVLDDLGLEPQTENVRARITGLLVMRHDADRPTLVTTNLSNDDFQSTYGSGPGRRIITRLGQGWIQVGRPSLSRQAQMALEVRP
jgi:nucleoside-triphosphatase THEP1